MLDAPWFEVKVSLTTSEDGYAGQKQFIKGIFMKRHACYIHLQRSVLSRIGWR